MSDLHLGEGRNPTTGWIDPREDFLFDDDFADFLDHHISAGEWIDTEWTLIVAGDFVDFLQVTGVPENREDLEEELNYGLVAGPAESAWKIKRIMAGHPRLFSALARFSRNHRIVFVSGTHDAEFIFPEVRQEFKDSLRRKTNELYGPSSRAIPPVFLPWFYYDGRIYVEHGHQYDSANAFPSPENPVIPVSREKQGNPGQRVFLTLGSIFVRYLFNRVETSSPFADNIKPETRFIGWFIRNHPARALAYFFTDGGTMTRKIKESRGLSKKHREMPVKTEEAGNQENNRVSDPEIARGLRKLQARPMVSRTGRVMSAIIHLLLGTKRIALLLSGFLLVNLAAVLLFLSPLWSLLLPVQLSTDPVLQSIIQWSRSSQVPLAFILLQAASFSLAGAAARYSRKKYCCSRLFRRKAAEIDALLKPEYIIMGHCHETDLLKFPSGCQYINTGTWTKIFSSESSTTREEKEFIYTRIIVRKGVSSLDLMKWVGRGGTGRRANLIVNSP